MKGEYRGGEARGALLGKSPISQMGEDPKLLKEMTKVVDAARKPPISKFTFAKVRSITLAGMDRLRFAMPWCPGHETMAKARRAFFQMFESVYCPSGPLERWSRGGDATGIFAQREVVHCLAVRDGKLLGFLKALVGTREVFLEELLISQDVRGQKLAQHDPHPLPEGASILICDGREMREDTVPDDANPVAPSHGAVSLVNVLQTQLIAIWLGNVVLPGSVSQRFGFKITCDAARLRRSHLLWQRQTAEPAGPSGADHERGDGD